MDQIALVVPLGLIVWAGLVCRRARAADPVRATAWTWFTTGTVVAALLAILALATVPLDVGVGFALYGGGVTSLAVLGGIVAMAWTAFPGLRLHGLLDGLVAATVVLAIAIWAVVVPGIREGDVFLTAVFCLDLVASVVAACLAVSSASAQDRRIGRRLAVAGLSVAVADGFVALGAASGTPAPAWLIGAGWCAAALALVLAARQAVAGPRAGDEEDPEPTLRGAFARVLLPMGAVAALPFGALAVIVVRGTPLVPWERVFFSVLFVVVLLLAAARQAHLLLEHSRAERRERSQREEVQQRHDERLEQSIRDPLTGCYNRRYFFDALEKEVQRARRYHTQAALIMFDVDDFKGVNDTFGHAHGDEVLRKVAGILEPLLREVDSFARIGGEEFAVLLPETSQLDALMVADRLRTAVARTRILEGRRVTLSGGVGCCPADAETREELLRRTDAALYWAKRNGKDLCALTSDAIAAELAGETLAEAARGAHLYGLVASIDGQSRYTRDHSENVAAYASALGQALGLERERMIVLRRAALLHDIGKVAVPVGILSKTEQLTDADFEEIKRHSWVGATMLLRAGMEDEAGFVRHHHERFDGLGYPDRIAGEAIPFEARILFVCDSFEAMTSDRAYRSGMPVIEALDELERCAGSQFDPVIVQAFRGLVERDELPLAALRVNS